MGRVVMQQPNGKYSVWSTVVDNFILVNATEEEIVENYVEENIERLEEVAWRKVSRSVNEQKTYEYLNKLKEIHGEKEYNVVVKAMRIK